MSSSIPSSCCLSHDPTWNEQGTTAVCCTSDAQVFLLSGVIKFAKLRAGLCHKILEIAEKAHAKTRVGTDDGIVYQNSTTHLRFELVFREESLAEDFRIALKKVLTEYKKRKHIEFTQGTIIFPDICCEWDSIQKCQWDGDLTLVEVDQYESIMEGDNNEPSSDYDSDAYTAVTLNDETRLRMLEREDSYNLFRRKPVKCNIVRKADDLVNSNNPNNIVYLSSSLHQHFDVINSTEGIPQCYLRYVSHSDTHQQGSVENKPTPVHETIIEVVFKDDEAKNELVTYFNNPIDVNQTTIRLIVYFPNPREFEFFVNIKAEETLARWASYDSLLNG